MGLLDRVKGVRRPSEGQPVRGAEEVFSALLAVGGPDKPWEVRPGDDGRADLVAEWKVTEPARPGLLSDTYLDRTFQIHMRLVDDQKVVRTVDKQWKVTWVDSDPRVTVSKKVNRGVVNESSSREVVERDEHGNVVATSIFRFATADLKQPLSACVVAAGWTWEPLMFGRL